MPKPPDRGMLGEQSELFPQFEIVFEDLAVFFEPEQHKEEYTAAEVGATPRERAKAGRANQAQQPVLYFANNRSTALAEVRPWKGASVAVAEVKMKRRLLLIDLSQVKAVKSPFLRIC